MRKQCKRKHWKPVNPIHHVLDGIRVTPSADLDKLRLRELAAIESFRLGQATLQDWTDVNNMLSLSECMARKGVGHEALEACQAAQTALIEAAKRYEQTKKMGTTGPGLQAMRDLFEYYDLQRSSISRGEYERHIQSTINAIRSKAPGIVEI